MAQINQAELEIVAVDQHPGRRRARLVYDLVVEPGSRLIGRWVTERAVLHGQATEDPVATNPGPILEHEATFIVAAGTQHREVSRVINRVDLDVDQDWWSTDEGGGTVPIAEWMDHVVGEISIVLDGEVIHDARTPVVTGSWGALGES